MNKYCFIGDIHACFEELEELLKKISDDRTVVFLGDCFDRGPFGLKVLDLVYDMVINKKTAKYVPGNHCNKFYRWCKGAQVSLGGGIKTTVAELSVLSLGEQTRYKQMFIKLYETSGKFLMLDHGKVVAVHAGWREDLINMLVQRDIEAITLYNDVTGQRGPDKFPTEWVDKYDGKRIVVRGHIVYKECKGQPYVTNNVYSIDTGCVHGGNLTGMLYPEMEFIQVKAKKTYHEGH